MVLARKCFSTAPDIRVAAKIYAELLCGRVFQSIWLRTNIPQKQLYIYCQDLCQKCHDCHEKQMEKLTVQTFRSAG